jgi:integrase
MTQSKDKKLFFKEEFERGLEGKGLRTDKIQSVTLEDLVQNRNLTDRGSKTLAQARSERDSVATFLRKTGLNKLTIKDIVENDEAKKLYADKIIQALEQPDTKVDDILNQRVANRVLGYFKSVLGEAGVVSPKGTNPARNILIQALGEKRVKEAFDTSLIPRKKIDVPDDPITVYSKLKQVISGVMEENKRAGSLMAIAALQGMRVEDFSNLRIENINFKTGTVTNLQIKDDKSNFKNGYFSAPVRDILLNLIGDRKTGKVFGETPQERAKLVTLINKRLKEANISVSYTKQGERQKPKLFTQSDFRKFHETHLTMFNIEESDMMRKAMTLRMPSGTVETYVATGAGAGSIENAYARTSAAYVALSGSNSLSQWLSDIGIDEKNISKQTRRYTVIKNTLMNMPPYMLDDMEKAYPNQPISSNENPIERKFLNTVDSRKSELYKEVSYVELQNKATKAKINLLENQKRLNAEKNASRNSPLTGKYGDSANFNLDENTKLLDKLKNMGIKALAITGITGTAASIISDPAQAAKDIILEEGADKLFGLGKSTFLVSALRPKPMGSATIFEEEEDAEGFATKPRPVYEKKESTSLF